MTYFQKHSTVSAVSVPDMKINRLAASLLGSGESVLGVFRPETLANDQLIFTDRQVIYLESKDLVGKKYSLSVLPYRSIQSFQIETAGVTDLRGDTELQLVQDGKDTTVFRLIGNPDLGRIAAAITSAVR